MNAASALGWTGLPVPAGVTLEPLAGGPEVVPDVRLGAVACGVRASAHRDAAAPDLALLDVGRPVPAAVVVTTNQVRAAACDLAAARVAAGPVRAVVANSGNANACTGAAGREAATAVTAAAAVALGCTDAEVVPMSTGVIGVPLPAERLVGALPDLAASLGGGEEHGAAFARAIMTTDSVPKRRAVRVTTADGGALVGGVAKGSGMIEPALATMLCVVVTDADLDAADCREVLGAAVAATFNRISVDACGSTNDTVLLLATGTAGPVDRDAVAAGVTAVCAELAAAIVRDGEGVTRVARLRVTGAPDAAAADAWGRAVASSALFRTALHGSDPNWGRILAAMGTTAHVLDPGRIAVAFGGVEVCRDGAAVPYDHAAAVAVLRADEVDVHVDMGLGSTSAALLVGDLSAGYVEINAEYTT
ncbi:MAG: bifunctional glutamate N-acetyltransferase/amino-acid acetyltransferase ArgJ [Nitriliruptoraceae bacterium]